MDICKGMIDMIQNSAFSRKQIVILNSIYVILTFAVLSDILRIPGTSLTFFRLSMPIAFSIILMFPAWAKKFMVLAVSFLAVNLVFSSFFYQIYRGDLVFDLSHFLRYSFLYFSVFLIMVLICIIKDISGERFEITFMNWIWGMGVILIVALLLYNIVPDFFGNLPLDNPNNYGCYIAAVFPFYLVGAFQKKNFLYFILPGICLILMYINDSKVSFFGVLIQIGVLFCISKTTTKRMFCIKRLILPVAVVLAAVVLIFFVNPAIHGYSLQGIILEPLQRILTNNPYPTYAASVSFRSNTTIFGINTLWDLKGMGVGAGNFGVLLKQEFPDLNPAYTNALNSTTISLHNSWLEFMEDFGIIAIVLLGYPLIYSIKLYFCKQTLEFMEKIALIFIFSFPIWTLGPSGVYTQYYLFAIIVYLVICRKDYRPLSQKYNAGNLKKVDGGLL